MPNKLNDNELNKINGGGSTFYKYNATIMLAGGNITLTKDGFTSEAAAKSAAEEAVKAYLIENNLPSATVRLISVTKYLNGEDDPYVIKPHAIYGKYK